MSLNLERKLKNESRPPPKEKKFKEVFHFTDSVEEQRWRLERVMENPENAVLPPLNPQQDRGPYKPREFNPHVMGSTAGAGSGEFHTYRHGRNKEMARLAYLDRQAREDQKKEEFIAKRLTAIREAEDKTAKKREKRQKRKQAAKKLKGKDGKPVSAGKSASGSSDSESDSDDQSGAADIGGAAANEAGVQHAPEANSTGRE